jgi:hypothetical protein
MHEFPRDAQGLQQPTQRRIHVVVRPSASLRDRQLIETHALGNLRQSVGLREGLLGVQAWRFVPIEIAVPFIVWKLLSREILHATNRADASPAVEVKQPLTQQGSAFFALILGWGKRTQAGNIERHLHVL